MPLFFIQCHLALLSRDIATHFWSNIFQFSILQPPQNVMRCVSSDSKIQTMHRHEHLLPKLNKRDCNTHYNNKSSLFLANRARGHWSYKVESLNVWCCQPNTLVLYLIKWFLSFLLSKLLSKRTEILVILYKLAYSKLMKKLNWFDEGKLWLTASSMGHICNQDIFARSKEMKCVQSYRNIFPLLDAVSFSIWSRLARDQL